MKLTVVGSAPAWTRRPGNPSSCYLIEEGDHALALDLGQGAFAALARYRSPAALDAVLISHLHADHMVDLVPLRHFLKFEAGDERPPRLHGPAELRRRFDLFLDEDGFLDALEGEALAPGEFVVGGLRVEAHHVTHIADSYAFRVASATAPGAGLVYSGDCAEASDLLALIRPGDTLLCEAASGAGPDESGLHLSAGEAAWAAEQGRAGRLILTHILDRADEEAARQAAADAFGGEIVLARPDLTLEVR